jgi:hypothetical protein
MMWPRIFALALLTGAAALLAGTVAANVLLDPQRVFGTPLVGIDENANYRYHRLRQYQAAPERIDALLFASSRGRSFAPDLTAHSMGARAVAKFDVTAAMMTDHLPALQYILRDKAARGERIKTVLLLLDVDTFGKLPSTNVNIDSFLPPEESGEHPVRFWWRYLTVFQLRMWRGMLAERWRGQRSALPVPSPVVAEIGWPLVRLASATVALPAVPARTKLLVATRPNLAAHVQLVRQFAALCRVHGIALTVATAPMRADARSLYEPEDLRDVVERLSQVVPLWDFTEGDRIATNPDFWDDFSHFNGSVARMMLARIYGGPPSSPGDFGVLRGGR